MDYKLLIYHFTNCTFIYEYIQINYEQHRTVGLQTSFHLFFVYVCVLNMNFSPYSFTFILLFAFSLFFQFNCDQLKQASRLIYKNTSNQFHLPCKFASKLKSLQGTGLFYFIHLRVIYTVNDF